MNKHIIYLPEAIQLQELIDFYHANLLLAYEHYYLDAACIQFFKDMLHSLENCRQISVSPHQKSAAIYNAAYYFPWFITFQFFPAAFDCIENMLGQLLHNSPIDVTPIASRQSLGKSYRLLAKQINISCEYAASFDLLDALHSRLTHQHDTLSEYGNVALTTYRNQAFVTTYGLSVELVSPQLLFALLKDIGELVFTVYSKAKCSLSSMCIQW
jgi:hypothetical protein